MIIIIISFSTLLKKNVNAYSYKEMKDLKLFDATYEFSPRDSLKYFVKDMPYSLYTTTLYKDIDYHEFQINNMQILVLIFLYIEGV